MTEQMPDFLLAPLALATGETRHVQFGYLDLWIRRQDREWRAAARYDAQTEDRPALMDDMPIPEGTEWKRWVTGETTAECRLRPVCLPRPTVVRPEAQVSLLPGQATDFFIGLPLWLDLSVSDGAIDMCEFPAVKLSNTWFGEPTTGELCYAMRTLACSRTSDLSPRLHRAICPLQVRNSADTILTFERICLRCQHLSIFSLNGRLWTNTVRLTHLGQNEWSRVVYGGAPHADGAVASPVSPAREPVKRGFLGSSFLTKLKPQI